MQRSAHCPPMSRGRKQPLCPGGCPSCRVCGRASPRRGQQGVASGAVLERGSACRPASYRGQAGRGCTHHLPLARYHVPDAETDRQERLPGSLRGQRASGSPKGILFPFDAACTAHRPPNHLETLPPRHQTCPVSKDCLKTDPLEAKTCPRSTMSSGSIFRVWNPLPHRLRPGSRLQGRAGRSRADPRLTAVLRWGSLPARSVPTAGPAASTWGITAALVR